MVEQVRRFNRTVTERVGALNDHFLGTDRPLGEARLLWEIGLDGCEVRLLRARLGLDSGYVSRLLRALEADGLVEVAAGERDRRVRVARLTAAGRARARRARQPLGRPRALAAGPAQRAAARAAGRGDARRRATADRGQRRDHGRRSRTPRCAVLPRRVRRRAQPALRPRLRPVRGATALPHEVRPPAGEFFVAYLHGEPIGCGAVKHHADAPGRDQAHVDRSVRARARARPPAARARSRRARRPAARDVAHIETSARPRRGDRALPLSRLGSRCRRSTTSRSPTTGSRSR